MNRFVFFFILSSILTVSLPAGAWGRRGHSLIAQSAGMTLAARDPAAQFARERAYDLGYYANVPDIIWKQPSTYETERPQHFMDLEIFDRALKGARRPEVFALDRVTFERTYPAVALAAGRSFWRIRELEERLQAIADDLNGELSKEKRHELQAQWLLTAGVIGHYVGDLSQPMHVSENYDGQMTGQKGIHSFFEDRLVDEFPMGEIEQEVGRRVKRLSQEFHKKNHDKSTVVLLNDLANNSSRVLPELLKLDKKVGRQDVTKARLAFRQMLIERMTLSSLYLSEIWAKHMGFKFDLERFYTFIAEPEYIQPHSGDHS